MTKSLISTINQTLVKDFGIKVIATTHSPSTVALAPDDALYTMAPNEAGLKATSKAEALNILTVGVPTLAISSHGRRQVFVESPADAAVYDALYSIWNVNNKTERSLDFISPGLRSPTTGQDVNTGCEAVLKIVNALKDAGNSSVFGLLDWDGARTGQPRIIVLAEGKRNGLENVLLDPLLVAAFIARDGSKADKIKAGIPEGLSYLSFLDLSAIELQKIVECIETAVLPQPPCSRVTIHYAGGLTLSVGEEYLTVDDHELENLVLDAFPFMRAFSRSAGKLMQKVVSTVLTDKPSFMPDVIGETFELLLNEPAHQS
jgi:hypothetical protein